MKLQKTTCIVVVFPGILLQDKSPVVEHQIRNVFKLNTFH